MTFSASSQFIRAIYGNRPPRETDLCNMFWRGMGKLALLALTGATLGIYLSLWIASFWEVLFAHGMIALTVAILAAIIFVALSIEDGLPKVQRAYRESEKSSIVTLREIVQFLKGNYCPKVEITHDDDEEA